MKKKKIIRIIVIILLVILMPIVLVTTMEKISDFKVDYDIKHSKTLMEYVANHAPEKVGCLGSIDGCNAMQFASEKFKCDVLDEKNVIVLTNDYLILDDYSIYQISFYDLFSNDQNCKEINTDIEIKNIKKNHNDYTLIDKNNNLYNLHYRYDELKLIVDKIEKPYNSLSYEIITDNSIKQILFTYNYRNGNKETLVAGVLKDDGSIYKEYYNVDYDYSGVSARKIYTHKKEEIFFSNKEYGKLKQARTFITREAGIDTEAEIELWAFLTDDNYYSLKEILTDECINYIDVDCEKKIVPGEVYNKFKKDIKFIGEQYTILSDNSIIVTDYLSFSLDK